MEGRSKNTEESSERIKTEDKNERRKTEENSERRKMDMTRRMKRIVKEQFKRKCCCMNRNGSTEKLKEK